MRKSLLSIAIFFAAGLVLFSCQKEAPLATNESATDLELRAQQDPGKEDLQALSRRAVTLPAGSSDALADAIEEAGPRGVVYVERGEHFESGTVTITHSVRIIGEPGAVLIVATELLPPASALDPALYLLNADRVTIRGLEIRPAGESGGTAILVEQSRNARILENTITGHQFSIILQHGDFAFISHNTIVGSSAWLAAGGPSVHGIIVINGDKAWIGYNDISNALFGIWACDKSGSLKYNSTHGNFIGTILCKVPQAIPGPGGDIWGSEFSATNWKVQNNDSSGNFDAGFLVIDGANNNLLAHNTASDNGTYDIELVGDSFRFGFLTPLSFENTVVASPDLLIKDCGVDNTVNGGIMVDTEEDVCF